VRDPERLARELRELAADGIRVERDADAEAAGILRLHLTYPPVPALGPDPIHLVATYPDSYPFFVVHVTAPDLAFSHHQHPLEKTLCLLERPGTNWRPAADTLAGLLSVQFAQLIASTQSTDVQGLEHLEAHVPEPATWYYPYAPQSAVLLALEGPDGGLAARVPASVQAGSFTLGLEGHPRPGAVIIRGAVLDVQDDAGNMLLAAPDALRSRYVGKPTLTGYWSRVERALFGPSMQDVAAAIYDASEAADPRHRKPPAIDLDGQHRLRLRAVLFPDERRWRGHADHEGDGWAFAVRVYEVDPASVTTPAARGARGRVAPQAMALRGPVGPTFTYLARPHRYARSDLAVRAPELAPLAARSVAVFGLGCLGAPSALELARASVGGLRLLDGDHVEAATTLRWPLGLSAVGWPKAAVVAGIVKANHPYVRVEAEITQFLGAVRATAGGGEYASKSEADIMAEMLDGASLLYDASAERNVQYFLSQSARGRGLPYVSVEGTPGAWGGMVVSIDPRRTEGCWGCLQHWLGAPREEGGIPGAPEDPRGGDVEMEGCADRTYAGANVDLGEVALMGVRTAMGILADCAPGGYPRAAWDVAVLFLRDADGSLVAPRWETFTLRRHPACALCADANGNDGTGAGNGL
jgi:hypothetical protein